MKLLDFYIDEVAVLDLDLLVEDEVGRHAYEKQEEDDDDGNQLPFQFYG